MMMMMMSNLNLGAWFLYRIGRAQKCLRIQSTSLITTADITTIRE